VLAEGGGVEMAKKLIGSRIVRWWLSVLVVSLLFNALSAACVWSYFSGEAQVQVADAEARFADQALKADGRDRMQIAKTLLAQGELTPEQLEQQRRDGEAQCSREMKAHPLKIFGMGTKQSPGG
jgi:hypothetical protein